MRTAPARGAAARSDPLSSAIVLETEEMTHRVSINHPIGCRGRLLHPNRRQMQELVEDGGGHGICGLPFRLAQPGALELGSADLLCAGTQRRDRGHDVE